MAYRGVSGYLLITGEIIIDNLIIQVQKLKMASKSSMDRKNRVQDRV